MKPKVVALDTKSQRQDRAIGDAPGLGRVAKVSDTERLGVGVSDGSSEYEDEDQAEPGEWLLKLGLISALLIGLLVGGGLIYFTALKKLDIGLPSHSDEPHQSVNDLAAGPAAGDGMLISEQDGLDLVRRGLAVRFASKVTDHFLYTDELEPPVVVDFLKVLAEKDGLVTRMEWLEPVKKNGIHAAKVRVYSAVDGKEHARDAYLLKNPEGEWRIDYESFASGSEPDWQRISSSRQTELGE